MVRNPGGGYGFTLNRISDAIQRYVVTRLQNIGPWGITNTMKSIARYFFGASSSALATIREKGEMAYQAGLRMTGLIRNTRIVPRENIPVDTSLPRGVAYRVKILVKGKDPMTGQETYRTVTADYSRNPSAETIKDTISQMNTAIPEDARTYANRQSSYTTNAEIDRVMSMVRRTY